MVVPVYGFENHIIFCLGVVDVFAIITPIVKMSRDGSVLFSMAVVRTVRPCPLLDDEYGQSAIVADVHGTVDHPKTQWRGTGVQL